MTLRFRLLLVYAIVVLLSVATVAIAIYELGRSHQLMRELQDWNALVLNVQKLKAASPIDVDLNELVVQQYVYLGAYFDRPPAYLDVDRVRRALNTIQDHYRTWLQLPAEQRASWEVLVAEALGRLASVLDEELEKLNAEADKQGLHIQILLATVIGLTVVHVALIGSLLRRWLLQPMERLGAQVQALARDEPPHLPLITSPREMADLAAALEAARCSLGAMRARLIESERLTTIGQFAAQLAHNLRNPLATMRATAQLAVRRHGDRDDLRDGMREIIASVDRLDRWIAGLMEVAREGPTPTREADVRPVVRRVADALEAELEKKELTIDLDLPDAPLICMHDPATLEHALVAMLVNAIEAAPLGGRIGLYTARVVPADASDQETVCRIEVRDGGKGLPVERPECIFEFSYSTKAHGMGLGLALARQALQRQGGRAGACNNSDGGATVYVELPIPMQ